MQYTAEVMNDFCDLQRLLIDVQRLTESVPLQLATKIELVIEEIGTNIIKFAYPADAAGKNFIWINIELDDIGAVVQFKDAGRPFNPLENVVPEDAGESETMDTWGIGGVGLSLVRQMAESCKYEQNDGNNIFEIILSAEG